MPATATKRKSQELFDRAKTRSAEAKRLLDEQTKKATDEKRSRSPEERKGVQDILDEVKTIQADAEEARAMEANDDWLDEPAGRRSGHDPAEPAERTDEERRHEQHETTRDERKTEEYRVMAFDAWMRRSSSNPIDLNERHEEACKALRFNPNSKTLVFKMPDTQRFEKAQRAYRSGGRHTAEERAMSTITGSTGGTLVIPESLVNALEVNMLAYGGPLQVAQVIRTETAEKMGWPTIDTTTIKGRRTGESAGPPTEVTPTTGKVYWGAHKYDANKVLVPYELFQNSAFDIVPIIGNLLGEAIGRIWADDLTFGTGVNQPQGIVTAAGSTSAPSATAIAWADLETLISSVDPAYRQGAVFMFHDAIRADLKKQVDGIGRPMWQDEPNGTEPASLKGYPWFINQSMDSTIASGKKTILFGRASQYKVRQVREIRIYRLLETRREYDEDVFLAFAQMDGRLLTAGTAPIKVLTH